jgi:hypothetical protein
MDITGTWILESWDRIEADGSTAHPLGNAPSGLLVYTPEGDMAVMMTATDRSKLDTDDPVGGSVEERAGAYSSCLAYVGRYRVEGQSVIHELETSLYPNWSGTSQVRPFLLDRQRLVLQVLDADGKPTNEISWRRRQSSAA